MDKISHDSEKPAVNQQVITACALIHREVNGIHKIFLAKRAATKKFLPSVYEIPGGHIDFGEPIVDGLKREVNEEFEVDITVGDPFFAFDYSNDIKGSHSAEIIFFAKLISSPDAIVLHPEDHESAVWASKDEFPSLFTGVKDSNDPEFQAIQRAFELLEGGSVRFE
jgi:8-oxo-dGTP pyrophosphatase MutT (NUDIX family)